MSLKCINPDCKSGNQVTHKWKACKPCKDAGYIVPRHDLLDRRPLQNPYNPNDTKQVGTGSPTNPPSKISYEDAANRTLNLLFFQISLLEQNLAQGGGYNPVLAKELNSLSRALATVLKEARQLNEDNVNTAESLPPEQKQEVLVKFFEKELTGDQQRLLLTHFLRILSPAQQRKFLREVKQLEEALEADHD